MKVRRGRILLLVLLAAAAALFARPESPPGPTGSWLRAAGLTPRFETIDGVRVRFVRAGEGPAIVLIHGFASSIVTWRDVMPALSQHHDVLALDLPGFGASDQPPDLSPALCTRVLLGLMDRLGIARAAFVGNSLGGAVAVGLAAEAPQRVERLVLLDAAGFNLNPSDRPFLVRLAGSRIAAVTDLLPVRRLLVRIALHQVFYDDRRVTPDLVEEYAAPLFRPGALASARSLLAFHDLDFGQSIARVQAPTLIVWGREDAWIPLADADRFAAAIHGSRKVILEACGHMPQEERPADTLRLLGEFLGG